MSHTGTSGGGCQLSEITRREGIARAHVIQGMGMLRLAPEMQEHILSMPGIVRRPPFPGRQTAAAHKQAFHLWSKQVFTAIRLSHV